MKKEILPLGSVVLLNGGTKKVMIIGYCMKTPENPNKMYDYCGCVFPEGVLRSDVTCVFDHEQIKEICFSGFKNEEANKFIDRVITLTEQEDNIQQEQQKEEPRFQIESLETE
ncbi:MAG: DUF4176 domain-containing protein [bacterium]|nr:DUF4176 domain-containing protein [bacterium]